MVVPLLHTAAAPDVWAILAAPEPVGPGCDAGPDGSPEQWTPETTPEPSPS